MTEVHAASTWPSRPSRTYGPLARRGARVQATDAAAPAPYRRRLQIGLGLIWLLDAALQFQPYMFTKNFPNEVIAPTGQGSPGWVEHPVTWAADLMAGHIVVLNALFALTQLAIAVGILYRRTVRPALLASIVWSLAVWWLGEGLGGMLAGAVSPLKGAPGAVLIYLLIAVLVWPAASPDGRRPSVATASPLGPLAARVAWLVLWSVLAVEALLPDERSPSGLHDLLAGNADGEPGWVKSIDSWAAGLADHRGTELSLVLGVLLAVVAVGVFTRWTLRPVLVLAVLLSLVIWVAAENFGALATGKATDPNSGPLLALLAATYWPVATTGRRSDTRQAGRGAEDRFAAGRSAGDDVRDAEEHSGLEGGDAEGLV